MPLMIAAALTADVARHQGLITAAALVAAVVSGHAALRNRTPAQLALFVGITLWAGSATSTVQWVTDSYSAYPTVAEWLVGNRRRLFRDLGDAFDTGAPSRLALFDLNGFKALNDTQGHAAGDALLAAFARRLRDAVDGVGSAYRLGGDEFCVLVDADAEDALTRARSALHGQGVTASTGSVLLGEATDPTHALSLAYARMYADKTRN